MILNLDHEITVVAMVRSLTSAIRRGSGSWLADGSVIFLRAELYNRDELKGWDYRMDAEAARRLTIWCERVANRIAA